MIQYEDFEEHQFIYFFIQLFNRYLDEDYDNNPKEDMNWSTNSVGSFFFEILKNFKKSCRGTGSKGDILKRIHKLFTLPNQNISLPHISFLYTANDFRVYKDNEEKVEEYFEDNLFYFYLKECVNDFESNAFHDDDVFLEEKKEFNFFESSPCFNLTRYPTCQPYCNWHRNHFNDDFSKDEFITLMKYAIPGRKLSLDEVTPSELKIFEQLFGKDPTENLKYSLAPFSLVLFCYIKEQGFSGDELGMFAKACNDFFPTPSDKGICLTKNMDIKEVMHVSSDYEPLFEQNKQNPNPNVMDKTTISKSTLVFFTGYGKNWMDFSDLRSQEPLMVCSQLFLFNS